ncbi:hypothetical protein OF83DRAFT_50177 [Amylostereum chailletii]|nr:hypothetical protein OF83DRAFT_50177 [Amylostereum chailletii]
MENKTRAKYTAVQVSPPVACRPEQAPVEAPSNTSGSSEKEILFDRLARPTCACASVKGERYVPHVLILHPSPSQLEMPVLSVSSHSSHPELSKASTCPSSPIGASSVVSIFFVIGLMAVSACACLTQRTTPPWFNNRIAAVNALADQLFEELAGYHRQSAPEGTVETLHRRRIRPVAAPCEGTNSRWNLGGIPVASARGIARPGENAVGPAGAAISFVQGAGVGGQGTYLHNSGMP